MLKAPSLSKQINGQQLLWFSCSNSYIIAHKDINKLINLFVSNSKKSFFIRAASEIMEVPRSQSEIYYEEIKHFLSADPIHKKQLPKIIPFDASLRAFSETYLVYGKVIKVNYSHKQIKELLHPQIAHLILEKSLTNNQTVFDVFFSNSTLNFYKNSVLIDSYKQSDYPTLQGTFCMQLLCVIHEKTEEEWLGTIHASTVANEKEAILVIGESGKGKSTFTTHAMAAGLNLVADDLSAVLAKNKHIYSYPGAISIKSGAFESLSKIIPGFDKLPLIFKGQKKRFRKICSAI